jgi:hypothetical protein
MSQVSPDLVTGIFRTFAFDRIQNAIKTGGDVVIPFGPTSYYSIRDNLMPQSPRFNRSGELVPEASKSKFMPQSEPKMTGLDSDYMKAVESSNVEAQQRMVDEAAKQAGYNVGPVYHRGGNWSQADFDLMDKRGNQLGLHVGTEKQIKNISKRDNTSVDKKLYISAERSVRFNDFGVWNYETLAPQMRRAGIDLSLNEVTEFLRREQSGQTVDKEWVAKKLRSKIQEAGYDSVVYLNMTEGIDHVAMAKDLRLPKSGRTRADYTEQLAKDYGAEDSYIIFSPSKIKSADLITRDDSGNVIPLSKRFDVGSEDIRFMPTGRAKAKNATDSYPRSSKEYRDPMLAKSISFAISGLSQERNKQNGK